MDAVGRAGVLVEDGMGGFVGRDGWRERGRVELGGCWKMALCLCRWRRLGMEAEGSIGLDWRAS